MSERIYRALLRLYPGRFRESYGEEALQLFRDRIEDESGWLRRSRLWMDLLWDLGAIRIRGYHEAAAVGAVAAAEQGAGGPSFASLEVRGLETRFLVWGGFVSVIFCGAALLALQYGGGHLPFHRTVDAPNGLYSQAKLRPKIEFTYEPRDMRGGLVRLHAVVRGQEGAPTPTGTVNFLNGGRFFGDGTLENGSVLVEEKVARGRALSLNAIYSGDSNYSSANWADE